MVPVVFLDRPSDRLHCRLPVEGSEAQVVVEQAPDLPFEAVELRQGVFAEGEEDIDAEVGSVDRGGELGGEGPGAVLAGLVEEKLLELVEDNQQGAVEALRPDRQGIGERRPRRHGVESSPEGLLDGVMHPGQQPGAWVVAPGPMDDDGELGLADLLQVILGQLAHVVDDARIEHGTLAHAAGAVQDRQARGHQVRHDDAAVRLAAEEEERVSFLVAHQPLEGAFGECRATHAPAPACGQFSRQRPRAAM